MLPVCALTAATHVWYSCLTLEADRSLCFCNQQALLAACPCRRGCLLRGYGVVLVDNHHAAQGILESLGCVSYVGMI